MKQKRTFLVHKKNKRKSKNSSEDERNERKESFGGRIMPMIQGAVAAKLVRGVKHQTPERLELTENDVYRELTYRDLQKMKFQDIERYLLVVLRCCCTCTCTYCCMRMCSSVGTSSKIF